MAQTVLITLTGAGNDTGPFDLYTDVDGYVTPFANNIAKATLEAGYTSVVVPDGATIIRVQSDNSICENYSDLAIITTTTTTSSSSTSSTTTSTSSTTTSSTTLVDICPDPPYDYYLADSYNCEEGCTLSSTDVVVALSTSVTAVIDDYYSPCVFLGLVFKLKSTTSVAPAVLLIDAHGVACLSCL